MPEFFFKASLSNILNISTQGYMNLILQWGLLALPRRVHLCLGSKASSLLCRPLGHQCQDRNGSSLSILPWQKHLCFFPFRDLFHFRTPLFITQQMFTEHLIRDKPSSMCRGYRSKQNRQKVPVSLEMSLYSFFIYLSQWRWASLDMLVLPFRLANTPVHWP